jgi:subtilisin family serine protease
LNKTTKLLLSAGLSLSMLLTGIAPGSPEAAMESQVSKTKNYEGILKRYNLKLDGKVKSQQIKKDDKGKLFSPDKLIIKYKQPLSAAEHKKAGTKLIHRVSSLNYDIVQVTGKTKLEEAAKAYASMPNVLSISRSANIKRMGIPDMKAGEMYHLKTLNVDKALTLAGKNAVRVAVIDTGIDVNHPELKNKIISNINVFNPMQKGAPDLHGTHVAGIIGAEKNNGVGGYGVNPNVKLISIDVFNRSFLTTDYIVAEGIMEAIKQKAQVINMSLGAAYSSPILEEAVKKALDANITIVAAAGNSGSDELEYPASYEGVISVGATNDKNELAFFSNYGTAVDVVAPGEDIYSPVFDIDKKSSFMKLDGTSMSSPMVAGTAALLLSKNPKLTPYQIQYILTKTAKDLGEKGYDLKYGHGLVDPVAALQFNPKQIPANPAIPDKDVLKKAEKVDVITSAVKSGKFTRVNQTNWYQLKVKEGEWIQTKLKGAKLFDYKYELLFYPEGQEKPSQRFTVNDVGANQVEGNLFRTTAAGTLAIGVKDASGNYNENGRSTYTLTIEKGTGLLDDGNTEETPNKIESLPYQSDEKQSPFYFTNELEVVPGEGEEPVDGELPEEDPNEEPVEDPIDEPMEEEPGAEDPAEPSEDMPTVLPGDSDFFRFTVPNEEGVTYKTVKTSVSGVPGINSSLNVYMIESMKDEETGATIEEKVLIDSVDDNGYGAGETLTIQGIPGKEYILEVTNKPFFHPLMFLFEEPVIDLTRSYSSHVPYTVSIDTKTLPADEDGYPMMEETPEEALKKGDIDTYLNKKEKLKQKLLDPIMMFNGDDWFKRILESALPYKNGDQVTGYFQYSGDEDWYAFTPSQKGIYEFTFTANHEHEIPVIEIYTYDAKMKDMILLGTNKWGLLGDSSLQNTYRVGLKNSQTYYLNVRHENYRASFNAYSFTSKVLVDNPMDTYENNDEFERAKSIAFQPIQGNFASIGDVDIYYFKSDKDGLFGFVLQPLNIPSKYQKLPKDVQFPIDPYVVIIEDTNNNKKLDKEEEGKFVLTDSGWLKEEERGSFKAKKGKGYFIYTSNYYSFESSVMPYQLTIVNTNRKDEDHGSVIKNNVPSKPIALKKEKNGFVGTGWLNVSNKGDVDVYKLKLDKNQKVKIKLDVPVDIDGVVTVFEAKGKQLVKADQYGKGDAEYFVANLKKGTYFIKVEDAFGNASVSPYKLTIQN